ncbi:MAG TPA: MerR family transcriptional regulator [Gemmatimonadales bacterium]|nr:MerR family transcriptional regulator [Gemmatimonadales bacterium]
MDTLTIGQVASAAHVNIQTVRYYERRGLVPTPPRSRSGYRQYAPEALTRLRFIRHAQDLGFSLEEVRELLALRVRPGAACGTVVRKTRQKLDVVSAKIGQLRRLKGVLEHLVEACDSRSRTDDCPVLHALEDEL